MQPPYNQPLSLLSGYPKQVHHRKAERKDCLKKTYIFKNAYFQIHIMVNHALLQPSSHSNLKSHDQCCRFFRCGNGLYQLKLTAISSTDIFIELYTAHFLCILVHRLTYQTEGSLVSHFIYCYLEFVYLLGGEVKNTIKASNHQIISYVQSISDFCQLDIVQLPVLK